MSTSRKLKSHGMRRGKNRAPHKGVKRGGSKRKYRKGSLKSRKRGDDGRKRMNVYLLTRVPVAHMSFLHSQSQLPLPRVTPPAGSALVDFKQHQAARGQPKGDCQGDLKSDQSQREPIMWIKCQS
uniref:Spermatid nuclear transition protein 1 n=1 Tax=Equus asinus TaxID=9793 RepID=A0A9L0J106_EQUAS